MTTGAPHGSPAGYNEGCRSAGGCENHGSDELLTCLEAATARRNDWAMSRLPIDQPISRAALVIPKAPKAVSPPPATTLATAVKVKAEKPKPASTVRPRASRAQRSIAGKAKQTPATMTVQQLSLGRHGSITGYHVDGCKDPAECPASPSCSEVAHGEAWIRNAPDRRHGTITGYYIDGCDEDASCPATPSCAEVAAGAPAAARPIASPAVSHGDHGKPAKQHEHVHGTAWGYQQGCHTETDCPNIAAGGPSCYQAKHDYYAEWLANARAGNGPELRHGTEYAYKLGCTSREDCPARLTGGISCRDAALEEERKRRRAAGVKERPPLVDAQPARKHIENLRSEGMGILKIAEAAQVSKTVLRSLIYGRDDYSNGTKGPRHGEIQKRLDAEISRRILEVEPVKWKAPSNAEHGTRNGYRRFNCRSQTDCPNQVDGGKSCYQANSEYNAAHRAPASARSAGKAAAASR